MEEMIDHNDHVEHKTALLLDCLVWVLRVEFKGCSLIVTKVFPSEFEKKAGLFKQTSSSRL